jgi:ABC-type transporter Mla MlaB component
MSAALSPSAAGTAALSETVDMRRGHIRASGHLTRQGADLLWGTADSLRVSGHSHVVLDLRDVWGADAAGLAILHHLRRRFAASGDSLLIRHAPEGERRP